MKHLLLIALLALSCNSVSPHAASLSDDGGTCDAGSPDNMLRDAVEAHALADITLLVERRSDGAQLRIDIGSPTARYTSASTGKPVAMAVFLHTYSGDPMDRVVDRLPGYDVTATGEHRQTEVRHLLAFVSSVTSGPTYEHASWMCWRDYAQDAASFLACVDSLPLNPRNNPARPNGRWLYNMNALDTLSAIVMTDQGVTASPPASYLAWDLPDSLHGGPDGAEDSIWARFQRETGLFSAGAASPEWEMSTTRIPLAASDLEGFTAEEYMAFLRATDTCELPGGGAYLPGRCAMATQDAIPYRTDPRTAVYTAIQQDWHWTHGGFWLECPSATFSCSMPDRVSTIGRGGQYAMIDRRAGYRVVVSPTGLGVTMPGQPGVPTPTMNGYMLVDAVRDQLEAWAAL